MAFVAAKCTECGAAIEVDQSKEAGICPYCKTAFVTEKVINNYVTNIGKINIGTLNVQQRDLVSDVYFDEADKILYRFRDKKGGYAYDEEGEKIACVFAEDYPNRAMTHYIWAFIMLYRRDDTRVFGTWENCEWALERDVEKDDPTVWSENPRNDNKYAHCNHVARQLDQRITGSAGRFLVTELQEADRLATAAEKKRYGKFIQFVKDEHEALKRCASLYKRAIEIYQTGERGKKELRKENGEVGVGLKILKWLAIGVGAAILIFAIVATAISTANDGKEQEPTNTAQIESVIE